MGMQMKVFGVVALAAAALAAAAATAHAAPFQASASGLPFTPLTKQDVQQAPTCQNGRLCYTPQMIADAYDFPHQHSAPTGAGETIVVVVAYGSPFGGADFDAFNAQFGLPAVNITELDQQTIMAPVGSNDFLTWGLETSVDVEWAHALAPGAKIVLAVAANDDTSNLAEMTREVAQAYPDAIVVQSFGGDESGPWSDPDAMSVMDKAFASIALHGGSVVAASGDLGATNDTIDPRYPGEVGLMPVYPASSPLVLAVGGAEGNPYPGGLWNNGSYGGEQVWNELLADGSAGASGGGRSTVYPTPIWQRGVAPFTGRGVPDVAWNAAAAGGAIIAFGGRFGSLGGTSAAAPQWAAVLALANELRAKTHRPQVGLVTPVLYTLARNKSTYRQDFHDITVGNNIFAFAADSGLPGYSAGVGYDYATGLGTPDVARLLKDLDGNEPWFARFGDLLTSHGHGKGHVSFHPGR
jgi:subtilase family serine protease